MILLDFSKIKNYFFNANKLFMIKDNNLDLIFCNGFKNDI